MGHVGTEVNIAQLKARLSEYLRAVRQGNEVVIKDRETPVAKLVPYEAPRTRLVTIPPTTPLDHVDRLPGIRPKKLKPGDLERAIRKEKQEWIDRWMPPKSTSTRR